MSVSHVFTISQEYICWYETTLFKTSNSPIELFVSDIVVDVQQRNGEKPSEYSALSIAYSHFVHEMNKCVSQLLRSTQKHSFQSEAQTVVAFP